MDVSTTCEFLGMFPAPLEVDRYLYVFGAEEAKNFYYVFPAPREVDRYLYWAHKIPSLKFQKAFPSPLKVDRELYFHCLKTFISGIQSFRPLAR